MLCHFTWQKKEGIEEKNYHVTEQVAWKKEQLLNELETKSHTRWQTMTASASQYIMRQMK